ncbi:MAG: VacB/RNase II family 3'-5' exoribonuclease [Acidobacteriota bacterium]
MVLPEAVGMLRGVLETGPDEGPWRLPDEASEAAAWISPENRQGARPGDRVIARPLAGRRRRVGDQSLPEAKVVTVVAAPRRRRVGLVDEENRWVAFYSKAAPPRGGWQGLPRNRWLEVEEMAGGAVELRRDFGDASEAGQDEAVVIAAAELATEFPADVLRQAARLGDHPSASDLDGRRDLRSLHTLTIDGAATRDFDDALSLESDGSGGLRLGVHIADVAHYVPEGSPLDLEAYRRGTSVYFPGRVLPMFPSQLSDGLCSLQPQVDRLTLSVFLDLDGDGGVIDAHAVPAVIRSHRRWTYDEVQAVLDGAGDDGEETARLRALGELADKRRRRREARGALDFDSPVAEVSLDAAGTAVAVETRPRTLAQRIVEEAMLMANEAVARALSDGGIFRIHRGPRAEDVAELERALAPLGLGLGEEARPADFAALLRRVAGSDRESVVSALVMRALGQATYGCDDRAHFALAAPAYTHFTSPIRRYPDLVVHRCLKIMLTGRDLPTDLRRRLPFIARRASERERRATRAERSLRQWKLVRHLSDRRGETFSGRITGVERFGVFIELEGFQVAGLIPVAALGQEYFTFEAKDRRLVGSRSGRRFELGDRLEAVLAAVDERRRGLILELREPPPSRRGRKRRG